MGIVTYAQLRIVTSAKMKFVACLFLLFAVVYGKKELRASNCGSSRSISRLDALWDDKRSGPIDRNSVLNIRYTTGVDTSGRDPFDVDFKFSLAKYMIFGYVPVPGWVLDHAERQSIIHHISFTKEMAPFVHSVHSKKWLQDIVCH